eukprot:3467000-Rhodomonas_salina.1
MKDTATCKHPAPSNCSFNSCQSETRGNTPSNIRVITNATGDSSRVGAIPRFAWRLPIRAARSTLPMSAL